MKKTLMAVLLSACAGTLLAQAAADKAKPAAAAEKKSEAAAPAAPAPAAQPAAAPEKKPAAKPAAKQAEEPEESMVMIDDKAEPEGRPAAAESEERAVDRSGIPEAFGQCKGVTTDGGRTILIFESPETGAISFVHVVFGKNGVTWRPAGSLKRYGGEAIAGGAEGD